MNKLLEKMKIQSVSMANFSTADQIREHLLSFTPQKDVSGNRVQSIGQNRCQLCTMGKLVLAPAPIYCSSCETRIKQNVGYFRPTNETGVRHCPSDERPCKRLNQEREEMAKISEIEPNEDEGLVVRVVVSPIHVLLSCFLILYMFPLVSAASESGFLNLPSYPDQMLRPKSVLRLPNLLIGDDRKIYLCSEKTLVVFRNNGSISRTIPLKYKCNAGITPVLGASRRIYLIAENRLLKINTMKTQTPESAVEVLLGPEANIHDMNEIIDLSVSIPSSCLLVIIKNVGLFSYSYDGKLRWSTTPSVTRLGFRQGCRQKNITECQFISAHVIDHCDSNVYVLNNQDELYAVSLRSSHFKWIQNLSSLGKNYTITSGNNGKIYVTVPDKSVIFGLDVQTGNVAWQKSVGPLSTPDPVPVVDINGWISIGSLDGYLYSISPFGVLKKYPKTDVNDTVMEENPFLDCSGYAVYVSHNNLEGKVREKVDEHTYVSAMRPVNSTIKLIVPATGSVLWSETYPGSLSSVFSGSDLRRFLIDERVLLAFISISNIGNPLSCFSPRQKLQLSCSLTETKDATLYTGNEKAITLFLFLETISLIILIAMVRFCCTFWTKRKVQNQNLGNFLEKRKSLRVQKKVFDRTITELEKKAKEGTSNHEVIEKIGDLVREKERIERKLSTSYSLGNDMRTPESESLIPVFDKKSGRKDSVTIFHAISDDSSEEGSGNDEDKKRELKGKGILGIENSGDDVVLKTGGVKVVDEGREMKSGCGSVRKRLLCLTRNSSK